MKTASLYKMAKIDFLKEKADKYKILFKTLLNSILALIIGFAGLIYSVAIKTISIKYFWLLSVPLLILFIKLVIISLIIWRKSCKIDDELLKEI